jgi:phage terminase large subunit-like protein
MERERGLNISSLASLTPSQREAILNQLSDADALALLYDWRFLARPDQLPPDGDWRVWLILAGRGWGKTRTGAEWVRMQVESGSARRIALVGRTASDAREVMIDGESGLLSIAPPWNRPRFIASRRRLVWSNGAVATAYSGGKPDQLRGPQHDAAWVDELAAFRSDQAWGNLMMGLRLGTNPRVVVTTTPRPTRLIRMLADDPGTVVTHGTTFDNAAHLAPSALAYLRRRYEGTRFGEQELHARLLTDVAGALWRSAWFDRDGFRVSRAPELRRIVVAVDPAVSATRDSDETGIIAAGVGLDDHAYVLADASLRGSPDSWARAAVRLYDALAANQLIAEANNGGDLVRHTIATVDQRVPVRLVHASRGKAVRAEPVAALYEQGRVHHLRVFGALEEQMLTWTPTSDESPDRIDALVWAIWALLIEPDTFTAADAPLSLGDWRG